ncbi:MAG: glycosyltransferase family 4 protein [Segetibacter sp.]|nr:glycosyltransferase family 4 protein [Segetibacter sp.]
MHIVVFPGWYPSKVDKLSGDFIQRHMHAIAQYCRVSVVIPVKDNSIDKKDIVTIKKGSLTEIYYYYPSLSSMSWLDSLLSFIRYNYCCIKAMKSLNKDEKVNLVHLYVLQKNHLIGFLLKWFYKIPYVVSEQSTLYIDGRFDKMNQIRKMIFRWVFKKSASFQAVSRYLLEALKNKLQLNKDGVIIPNVVDSTLFYYNNDLTNDRITFVHVSNMTHQKNVEGMLHAFAEVKKVTGNFLLNLVGPLPDSISSLIDELGLSKNTVTWNERNYKEVAEIMQQSEVFVFFTRHETFGCVIIEANACGLPVIVSDLEVTRELISDNFNGVFVESENVKELSEKILFMINHQQKFDPLAISLQTRNKFNYERIGKQFFDWFTSLNPKPF